MIDVELPTNPTTRLARIRVDSVVIMDRQREVTSAHVERLRDSYEQFGKQLQAILVTDELVLIDGAHRLAAAALSGWDEIDAIIASNVDTDADRAMLEGEANAARKQLTPTEMHKLWVTVVQPRLSEQASVRRNSTLIQSRSANFAQRETAAGRTRDLAKYYVGMAADTLNMVGKLKEWSVDPGMPPAVRDAANEALARADKTGKVNGEYRRVLAVIDSVTAEPTALPMKEAATLVSRMVGTVTRASQDLRRLEMSAVVRALEGDPTAVTDWPTVIAAAAWILEFVEEAGIRAGIREVGR